MTSSSNGRRQSPQRCDAENAGAFGGIASQAAEELCGRAYWKTQKKDKYSDSEGSLDSEADLTSCNIHQPETELLQQNGSSMSTAVQALTKECGGIHSTQTGFAHEPRNAQDMAADMPSQVAANNVCQLRAPSVVNKNHDGRHQVWFGNNATDFHIRRLLRTPSLEEMIQAVRDRRSTPRLAITHSPIARAESPHLHRVARPLTEALERRQKELGRLILALCMILPPTYLCYAFGHFDPMMDWSTRGEISHMPTPEKKFAFIFGTVLNVGILIALCISAVILM